MGQALAEAHGAAALWTLLREAASEAGDREAKCRAAVWNGTDTQLALCPLRPSTPHRYRCTRRCRAFAAPGRPEATGSPGPGLYLSNVHCPGTPACTVATVTQASAQPIAPLAHPQTQGAQLTACVLLLENWRLMTALRTTKMVLLVLRTRYFSFKHTAAQGPQPGLRRLPGRLPGQP